VLTSYDYKKRYENLLGEEYPEIIRKVLKERIEAKIKKNKKRVITGKN
jgi:hypothetical protein